MKKLYKEYRKHWRFIELGDAEYNYKELQANLHVFEYALNAIDFDEIVSMLTCKELTLFDAKSYQVSKINIEKPDFFFTAIPVPVRSCEGGDFYISYQAPDASDSEACFFLYKCDIEILEQKLIEKYKEDRHNPILAAFIRSKIESDFEL